jgi:hypothetical protein
MSKRHGDRRCRSDGAQIVGGRLAGPGIGYNLEGDLLSPVEGTHSCTFDRPDVHENILAAILRLNETEASLAVEPLHDSLRHGTLLSDECSGKLHRSRSRFMSRDLEEVRQSDAQRRGEANSFGRNSIF